MGCPNCGAPITGDKCEYCGSWFTKKNTEQITFFADNVPCLTLNSKNITDDEFERLIQNVYNLSACGMITANEMREELKKIEKEQNK